MAVLVPFFLAIAVAVAGWVGMWVWTWHRARPQPPPGPETAPRLDPAALRRDRGLDLSIEEFYARSPRRRGAPEITLGDWLDGAGRRWRVQWSTATGEIYEMREPEPWGLPTGAGWTGRNVWDHDLVTHVLAAFGSEDELWQALPDWERHAGRVGGLEWLRLRMSAADAAQR